ncbi:thiopeptide maturation pyridine synthase [Actinomycetes bacterium KLBMP 9759]
MTWQGSWHSAQVHRHGPDGTDDLLLDAVRPLLAEIADDVEGAFFTRHWRRGPHIRIQVCCADEAWPAVRELITRRMEEYIGAHPSAGHPDPDGELVLHARLAELEHESGPLEPWHPDDSVQFEPFDHRLHVLGTQETADMLTEFHVASTPLAFDALAAMRDGEQLSALALRLMFASAELGCPPVSRGFLSYRSHAEGFLANTGDPAAMRSRFEQVYRRNSESLGELLTEVLADLGNGGTADGDPARDSPAWLLRAWVPEARRVLARATVLTEEGTVQLAPIEVPADDGPDGLVVSSFHRSLFGDEEVRRALSQSWFTVYRVLLNFQYLLFGRLGMAPRDRFLLCYLAARTVEDRYDLRMPDRLPAAGASVR